MGGQGVIDAVILSLGLVSVCWTIGTQIKMQRVLVSAFSSRAGQF